MKPQSKCKVWIHFIKSSCRKLVACSICEKTLKFFGNSTNMYKHLQVCCKKPKKKTPEESVGTNAPPKRKECVNC